MNGDRPTEAPGAASRPDPLLAEIEALRAEVLRLRRQERRHLTELAQFARMAEGKRPGWPRIKAALAGLRRRLIAALTRLKRGLIARIPARMKASLRRLQARYFP